MSDDTLFLSTSTNDVEHTCDWCGGKPAVPFEVEPGIYTLRRVNGRSARVPRKQPIVAYACYAHAARFHQQAADREEQRKREREAK